MSSGFVDCPRLITSSAGDASDETIFIVGKTWNTQFNLGLANQTATDTARYPNLMNITG